MKDSVPLAGNQQGVGDKEVSVGGIPSRKQMYVAILNLKIGILEIINGHINNRVGCIMK